MEPLRRKVVLLKLDALLADPEYSALGLNALQPLRDELDALVRPKASARVIAAAGPLQPTLPLGGA